MTIISMFGVFFTNFSLSSYIFFVMIFFLEDPTTFNLAPEKALSTAAWLVFIGYPFNLISSILSGYLFARYGRRIVITFGFIVAVTAILLIPFIVNKIYPSMCFITAAINTGTAFTQNPPLIADYVRPKSIGLAYAFQAMLTFLATIFAVSVLFGLTKDMDFDYAILTVCPILYLMSFISVCGLKEVKSNLDQQSLEND